MMGAARQIGPRLWCGGGADASRGRIMRAGVPDWRAQAQAKLLSALGSSRLGMALLAIAEQTADAGEIFGFVDHGGEVPEILVSQGSRGSAVQRAALYLQQYRALDPLHAIIREHAVEDAVTLASFRSRDIGDLDYRQRCFEHPGLVEKVSCFQRWGNATYVLTFYRSDAEFEAVERLLELAQLALPVLRRHGELLRKEAGLSLSQRLEKRLEAHFPLLTGRERQVCARTLGGMTAEAIALDLGVGRTSVLTYRRRAYERYGISSAGQLLENLLG